MRTLLARSCGTPQLEQLVTNVLLVDDHEPFRQHLRGLLATSPSLGLIHEAGDGGTAGLRLEGGGIDLMLIDMVMPGSDGISVARRALAVQPDLRIIMISMHSDGPMVDAALDAGASGYLLKDHIGEELEDALVTVMGGKTYVSVTLR